MKPTTQLAQFLGSQSSVTHVSVQPSLLSKTTIYLVRVTFRNFIGQQGTQTISVSSSGCIDVSIHFAQDL